MPAFEPGKLLDFARYYDHESPQNKEGIRQLEAHIRRLEEKYKVPEEERVLRDEASWAISYRKRPRPEPVSKHRRINQAGLSLIHGFEKLRLVGYDDGYGVPTIGWGHTGADVKVGQQITEEKANALFAEDIRRFEQCVAEEVDVPLNDNQFAALVSLCYNIGEGNFRSSQLLKKLNQKNYAGAADHFADWNKAGEPLRVSEGLVRRREEERKLFLKPVQPKLATKSVPLESRIRILSQNTAVSCGLTSVAMAVNLLTGRNIDDSYLQNKYGFALLKGLNSETPRGIRYRDAGNFTPELWDDMAESIQEGLPIILALNGDEFSPSGYGHIVLVTGIDEKTVRIADPNGGRWRTISRKLIEQAPPHSESGNFVFIGERY